MKKILTTLILYYLLFAINSSAYSQSLSADVNRNEKILRIGILLPLSGKFQNTGQSFLKAIQLALKDIGNKNIKIYPKDSRGNALDTYLRAKEFEEMGVKIVIGPIFFENLERLGEINNVTFISLTNKVKKIPKNTIAFGINIKSQVDILNKYFKEKKILKTLFLSPKTDFTSQAKIITDSQIKFKKTFFYDNSSKKITGEIERLTNYQERKKDLERRIEILKKSDLYKDKKEVEKLEQKHTLGEVNFDSVLVLDFGERLKSILTSFLFSDVSNEDVNFFTLNQWFDKTLFSESALQNLYFPAINLKNLNKFEKKYLKAFNETPNKVSILAYDAVGLIYYCWINNNKNFKSGQLYNKNGFKGLHGEFTISNNFSHQILKIYKVSGKKFIEIY
jgi:hypothetical protein